MICGNCRGKNGCEKIEKFQKIPKKIEENFSTENLVNLG